MNKFAGADVLAATGTSKIILGHFSRFSLPVANHFTMRFVGALLAVCFLLFRPFLQSAIQVLSTFPEADRIAWLVVLFVPTIIAVAQMLMETGKLGRKLSGADPDSKITGLEKRISELG